MVAVKLLGVVVLHLVRDLEEEVGQLRRGLVGEVEKDGDEWRGLMVHEGAPLDARDLAVRRERALERLAACSLPASPCSSDGMLAVGTAIETPRAETPSSYSMRQARDPNPEQIRLDFQHRRLDVVASHGRYVDYPAQNEDVDLLDRRRPGNAKRSIHWAFALRVIRVRRDRANVPSWRIRVSHNIPPARESKAQDNKPLVRDWPACMVTPMRNAQQRDQEPIFPLAWQQRERSGRKG